MTHHLQQEPDVIRRPTGIVFIDVPLGYREVREKGPQPRAANGRFARRT
jgi:hypothetical protein